MKFNVRLKSLLIFPIILLTSFYTVSSDALAQEKEEPSQGLPGRRVGGGSRNPDGECVSGQNSLTAIIPQNNLGTTVSSDPAILIYIPSGHSDRRAEFVLYESNDKILYERYIAVSSEAGIHLLQPSFSSYEQGIQFGTDYKWYFSIICDPDDRSKDVVVEGWIRRIKIADQLSDELLQASQIQKVSLYWDSGVWHEAVLSLYNLLLSGADDAVIENRWIQILEAEELHEIGAEALAIFNSNSGQISLFYE